MAQKGQTSTPNVSAPKMPPNARSGDGAPYCGYSQAKGPNTIGITTQSTVKGVAKVTGKGVGSQTSTPMRSPFGRSSLSKGKGGSLNGGRS